MCDLHDRDLEPVAAGAAKVNDTLGRANAAFDAHRDAMRTLERDGQALIGDARRLFRASP